MDTPTRQYVDAFAKTMEQRLAENRHKGDRPGWLKETPIVHVEAAMRHVWSLGTAVLTKAPRAEVVRLAADAANRLLMAADAYSESAR